MREKGDLIRLQNEQRQNERNKARQERNKVAPAKDQTDKKTVNVENFD